MTSHHAVRVIRADLSRRDHQDIVLELIDAYARDPLGHGRPLTAEVRARLIHSLHNHPTTLIFVAMSGTDACGIAVCFRGFSTFAGLPLTNVHDLYVRPSYRGRGISRLLLAAVEEEAIQFGCCKITLEVLEFNTHARGIYERFGFGSMSATVGHHGRTWFMTKRLDATGP